MTLEERVTALEAMLPKEYYTSRHSGEEIDNAVDRAASGGAIDKALNQRVNRNLLHNWYFADPIDQRGGYVVPPGIAYYENVGDTTHIGLTGTYYTAKSDSSGSYAITVNGATYYVTPSNVVRGYTGNGYTIDRWSMSGSYSDAATLLIEENCIRVISGNSFRQPIDNLKRFAGKTVTFSILIECISGGTGQIGFVADDSWVLPVVATPETARKKTLISATVSIPENITTLNAWYYGSEGTDYKFYSAKLELGTTQTLARQDENGNWVLIDPPPDKNTELLKCCMSTADLGDTYANNKMTPAAINGVNKAGDMMTGALSFNHRAFIADATDGQNWNAAFLQTQGLNSGAGFTRLVLYSPENWRQAAIIAQRFDGNGAYLGDCIILHTGNKPSGSYTGNGDATPRTIETGGIGNFCILKVHGYGISIVTMQGAYKIGSTYNGWTDGAIFGNGVLTLTTTDPYLNPSGVSVEYQVL